jgi:tRNA (guanine37-N1)-methyltransferase
VKRIDVFTLVPDAFAWFLAQHPVAGAVHGKRIDIRVHNLRDHTRLAHREVDDTPYGGGPGMVIRADVVAWALEAVFVTAAERVRESRHVLVLSPSGRPFDQPLAGRLAASDADLVLLAGRFEGFDARVARCLASGQISVGSFVLAGGELAAMAVVEAMVRHIPGVLGNDDSVREETFSAALGGAGEYPQYTRPRCFLGEEVPEALLSGNHARIEAWRRAHSRALR